MRERPFYVNYLPMPPGITRWLRVAVPAALWLACAAVFVLGRSQPDPGGAVWEDGTPRQFEGTIVASPYPMLVMAEGAVLLVESGKHGARDLSGLAGKRCRVSGWPLHRDGRRMLELEAGDSAVVATGGEAVAVPPTREFGEVVLRGEIVDSKCYLGAMKPGEGKTHKECATLCIRGGIPPMLVSVDGAGARSYCLITGPDGGALDAACYPYIADLVDVRGSMTEVAGMRVLRIAAHGIRRVGE